MLYIIQNNFNASFNNIITKLGSILLFISFCHFADLKTNVFLLISPKSNLF